MPTDLTPLEQALTKLLSNVDFQLFMAEIERQRDKAQKDLYALPQTVSPTVFQRVLGGLEMADNIFNSPQAILAKAEARKTAKPQQYEGRAEIDPNA